ncbi:MAG: aldehyde dehydrogenase family protein [Alphaproteobacteria bacterium]|nr:MAG: aldehyde dehydrogenase family protein [Alphaproteobacteria bacterium]
MPIKDIRMHLGIEEGELTGGALRVTSPIDGAVIGNVEQTTVPDLDAILGRSIEAFRGWRQVPAPQRGELIRLFGDELRAHKEPLGKLVSIESGKILAEGLGEVQEMIDICDFAVGLSRQLYGLTIASERPGHRMMETWHPLGPTGVITAFNFPVAVWAWNFAIALVCGNPVVWKPSEKTPISAIACKKLFARACRRFAAAPNDLLAVVIGGKDVAERLVDDRRVPLISATGSTAMGRVVGPRVAQRFGRTILELGGNNAMIVAPSADLSLALPAIVFSAVATAGQRCTSLRRLIVHENIAADLIRRLKAAYQTLKIGDPLDPDNLVGPLIDQSAFQSMQNALDQARGQGASIFGGQRAVQDTFPEAYYVKPALVEMAEQTDLVRRETFSPVLYVLTYRELDRAIEIHNDVPQGLSSSIFTSDMREAETFVSDMGSDCGIANVNIGTSGAEIGGAFGGEKETGGGREAGSDSWKAYMRRATNTINYSSEMPLAQGVEFDFAKAALP